MSIFDPALNFVRTFAVNAPIVSGAALGDGTIALSYQSRVGPGAGVHIVTHTGTRIASIGEVNDSYSFVTSPVVVGSSGGHIHVARPNEYVLTTFAPEGQAERSARRTADWFAPYYTAAEGDALGLGNGRSRTMALAAEDSARVWVLVRRFRAPRDAVATAGEQRGTTPSIARIDATNDMYLELIDLQEQRVIMSDSLKRATGFAGPGLVVTFDESDDGLHYHRVWRVRAAGERSARLNGVPPASRPAARDSGASGS